MSKLNRAIAPKVGELKKINLEYPHAVKLKSGHTAYLINNIDSQYVKLELLWTRGFSGSPLYLDFLHSRLVFSGTSSHDASDIEAKMKTLGCDYSFVIKEDHATLKLTGLAKTIDLAFNYLLEFYTEASFPEDELKVLKTMEIASLESKMKTPGYWASIKLSQAILPADHLQNRIAKPEDIKQIKADDIRVNAEKYKPNTCTIFIFGPYAIDLSDKISDTLMKYGYWQENTRETLDYRCEQQNTGEIRTTVKNTNQVVLQASVLYTNITEEQMPILYLLNMTLGGYFGSRLMKDVRETKGLTYGIGSSIGLKNSLFSLSISSQMNTTNVDLAVKAIKDIIDSLQKDGINSEEFDRSQRYYIGQLYSSVDGPQSMNAKIKNSITEGKPLKAFEEKCRLILNAQLKDVNEMAKLIYKSENFMWSLAGDVS